MNLADIVRHVDHTLLSPQATKEQLQILLEDSMKYGAASACIPPSYVEWACEYVDGRLPICTVIGFPFGYQSTEVKAFEAERAIEAGASEVDMVIAKGRLKEGEDDYVLREIKEVKKRVGKAILKVIVETALLSNEEKIRICRIVSESGADFIKTSTGYAAGGATIEDIRLFKEYVADHVKIKASGGIGSLEEAQAFIDAGSDRLGTSRIIKLIKEGECGEGY